MIGGRKQDQLSKHTISIIRIVGVIYAALYAAYGLLASLGLTETEHNFPLIAAAFLGAAWLAVAWWQYSTPDASSRINITQIGLFVILTSVYTYLITGMDSPFVALWALLIAIVSLLYGWRAFWTSATVLVIIAAAIAVTSGSIEQATISFISALVALITAYAITATLRQAASDQRDLDSSHAQAALQRDRTAALVNNLADAVVSTDAEGNISLYNAATLNLLDTNVSIDGKNIDEILRLSEANGESVSLTKMLTEAKAVTVRDNLFTIATGESTRLEVTYAPIRHGYSGDSDEGAGYIIIMRDVTKARSLDEERDEFISVVSHELRTPVAIAEGTVSNAQLILSRDDIPTSRAIEAVDLAHNQLVFLSKMVNDLSTLSRAERGVGDEAEDIGVNDLVKELFDEYEPEARDKGLKLNLRLPSNIGTVHTSKLYLKELLQNFITNAIKYTETGSITISAKIDDKGRVYIAITDTGVGISKADQKHILDKFYRSEDYRTRETSGTGLGLYVAAKLAKRLKTDIEIESRLNHGSTFGIRLPLNDRKKAKKKSKD